MSHHDNKRNESQDERRHLQEKKVHPDEKTKEHKSTDKHKGPK